MISQATTPSNLPEHLSERISVIRNRPVDPSKEYVLYWMHHALRDHENPAIDVAVAIGNRIGKPVLVYQGLGGNHSYNSDRHHVFIMEGARDVQQGLKRRGIAYRFYLPENPRKPTPLRALCREAALVITETFPVPPFPEWVAALADRIEPPLWTVDTCCIIPMQRIRQRFERAFRFRKHTWSEYQQRIQTVWKDMEPDQAEFTGSLPFPGIVLQSADFHELCARCRIDHGIGPVHHTVGGSRADYDRWADFKRHGLPSYARLRNDAAVAPPKGVSRLSPYIHFGMVSPFRIAREAAEEESKGAEKFLDEFLIWRELAHNFCFHTPVPENVSSLPGWARETLERHINDPRPVLYTPERLERAKTADPLWDALQRSLLRHGELHNNVRMTWGKALLQWTRNPSDALRILIDLNHRFALDGSDPNSYGGILWCLGLFDRPFTPEIPIMGSLRPRPLDQHAKRLDLKTYTEKVDTPSSGNRLHVAVIGAGLSGMRAANILSDHGHRVRVFEKSTGPGGRLGGWNWQGTVVDAGAQYFTARDDRFRRHVTSWLKEGIVSRWDAILAAVDAPGTFRRVGTSLDRYVGVPGMVRLAEHLSRDIPVDYSTEVNGIGKHDGEWRLTHENDSPDEAFDAVIIATPSPQAVSLLPSGSELVSVASEIRMLPCWAVMAVFKEPLPISHDGLFF